VFGFFVALMLAFIETSSDNTPACEFKGAAFPAPRSRCRIVQLLLKGIPTKRIEEPCPEDWFAGRRFEQQFARICGVQNVRGDINSRLGRPIANPQCFARTQEPAGAKFSTWISFVPGFGRSFRNGRNDSNLPASAWDARAAS
jgi:hypothetical protein